MNAPVAIDGGDGYDTVIVSSAPSSPTRFVITRDGVYGAGRFISYLNVERLVVDGMEGNDRFYVQSTNPNVETRIVGGLGSDRIEIAGHAPTVQADDLLGHTGIVTASIETATGTWSGIPIDGIAADIADADAPMVVVTPPTGGVRVREGGATSQVGVRLSKLPTGTVDRDPPGAGDQHLLDQPGARRRDLASRQRNLGHDGHAQLHLRRLLRPPVRAGPGHRRRVVRGHPLRRAAVLGDRGLGVRRHADRQHPGDVEDDDAVGTVVGGLDQGGRRVVEPFRDLGDPGAQQRLAVHRSGSPSTGRR